MSLSQPRANGTPVKRNFSLKLSTGGVVFYDRDAKKEVPVPSPFTFVVLDSLSFVGGFSDRLQGSIWSNEVRSTRDEKLTVRTRSGILAEGFYADIRDSIKADGAKFGRSLYIAYQDSGWQLGNLKLIGAGFSEWFEFEKAKRLDSDPGVVITDWEDRRKGSNKYKVPVFESWDVGSADLAAAVSLDEELQAFLGAPKPESASVPEESAEEDWTAEAPF